VVAMTKLIPQGPKGFLDFGRVFDDFFEPLSLQSFFDRGGVLEGFEIRSDIRKTDKGYQLICEVPGFSKDDIQIAYENNILTVSASRQEEKKEENEGYIRQERRSGRVSRSFRIADVDPEKIEARLENGVLTLDIETKSEADKRLTIPIK